MKYIAFSSRKIVADLGRLGIGPKKSLTLRYTGIPANLERHYLRGLFDGDGSIHRSRQFYFLGTEHIIDGVAKAVLRHTTISLNKRKVGKLWRLSGYGKARPVLAWMYRDATIFLRRKHQIFLRHWP